MAAEAKENEDDGEQCPFYFKLRNVPNDHSCLFHSIAYLLNHDKYSNDADYHRNLRQIVSLKIIEQADRFSNELAAANKTGNEYAQWIEDEFSWGGTLETAILAEHFGVDVVVIDVTADFFFVLNGRDHDDLGLDRIHIVYNGDHYDSVVAIYHGNDALDDKLEIRRFNLKELKQANWDRIEKEALQHFLSEHAKQYKEKKEMLDKLKNAKKYKCTDCGDICSTNEEMEDHMNQTEYEHCMFDEV